MIASKKAVKRQAGEVRVFFAQGRGIRQPEKFKLCPFGIQLYTPKRLPGFEPVTVSLELRPRGRRKFDRYDCSGIAIESVKQGTGASLFCTFVKFLYVPTPVREQLGCGGKHDADICNFCPGHSARAHA